MKLFQINFIKNNFNSPNVNIPKQNKLAPLKYDTVSFKGTRPKKEFPYSTAQKEREIRAIKAALNGAIKNSEFTDADKLSEITGLDIYVVKLRLSTNKDIKKLYSNMQIAYDAKIQKEKETQSKNAQALFETLNASGQQLTNAEIAFYLGINKSKLFNLLKTYPALQPSYKNAHLVRKNTPLLEKAAQTTALNKALREASRKDTYDILAKRSGLSKDDIRARLDENEKLFAAMTQKGIYPPEIYSEAQIEAQEDKLIKTMTKILKTQKRTDLQHLAQKANLPSGVVQMRIQNNIMLKETFKRLLGAYDDEN